MPVVIFFAVLGFERNYTFPPRHYFTKNNMICLHTSMPVTLITGLIFRKEYNIRRKTSLPL